MWDLEFIPIRQISTIDIAKIVKKPILSVLPEYKYIKNSSRGEVDLMQDDDTNPFTDKVTDKGSVISRFLTRQLAITRMFEMFQMEVRELQQVVDKRKATSILKKFDDNE